MKTLIAVSFLLGVAAALVEPEGRMTEAWTAKVGQFPYQAALTFADGELCGGTLISNRWLLTAAHCTEAKKPVTVTLGAWNRTDVNEEGVQEYYISEPSSFINHEYWDPTTKANDIALVYLPEDVQFTDLIQPATLPVKGTHTKYVGAWLYATGWGKTKEASVGYSPVLKYIKQEIISQALCNYYFVGSITTKQICQSSKDQVSSCDGDFGGPLVDKLDGINYLVGVNSYGWAASCDYLWPTVFTRVSSYVDWIEEKSGVVNN